MSRANEGGHENKENNAVAAAFVRVFSRKILGKVIRRTRKIPRPSRFVRALSKRRFHLATETGVHAVHSHEVVKLIKSGVLGLAAFETYERVIHRTRTRKKWTSRETEPLSSHLFAGMLAGVAHSMVACVWELCSVYSRHPKWTVNQQLILRRSIHHSIGFGTLFSTYEAIKRTFNRWQDGRQSNLRVVTSFISGGLAGQAHYVVSHFSRQYPKTRPPSLAGIASSFLPASLGFVAFALDQKDDDKFC